ncbi:hypothetical protein D3C72_2202610 [compost metagenome]
MDGLTLYLGVNHRGLVVCATYFGAHDRLTHPVALVDSATARYSSANTLTVNILLPAIILSQEAGSRVELVYTAYLIAYCMEELRYVAIF